MLSFFLPALATINTHLSAKKQKKWERERPAREQLQQQQKQQETQETTQQRQQQLNNAIHLKQLRIQQQQRQQQQLAAESLALQMRKKSIASSILIKRAELAVKEKRVPVHEMEYARYYVNVLKRYSNQPIFQFFY